MGNSASSIENEDSNLDFLDSKISPLAKLRFESLRIALGNEIQSKSLEYNEALEFALNRLSNSDLQVDEQDYNFIRSMIKVWLTEIYSKDNQLQQQQPNETKKSQDSSADKPTRTKNLKSPSVESSTPSKNKSSSNPATPATTPSRTSQRLLRSERMKKGTIERLHEFGLSNSPSNQVSSRPSSSLSIETPTKRKRTTSSASTRTPAKKSSRSTPNDTAIVATSSHKKQFQSALEAVIDDRILQSSRKKTPDGLSSTAKAKRKRHQWTEEEFKALYDGLVEYCGDQNPWASIKKDERFSEILCNRSVVDLKDKARNEKKARERKYGANSPEVGIFRVITGRGGEGAKIYAESIRAEEDDLYFD